MSGSIINPMDLYWIGTLDAFDTFSLAMAVVLCIVFVSLIIGAIYNADMMTYCKDNARYYRMCKTCSIVCGILFLVFVSSAIFIPDKRTMIEMTIAKYATHENIKLTTDGIKEVVDYIVNAIGQIK